MVSALRKLQLLDKLPPVRGKYRENADIGKSTWFQVGGAAEVLFKPEDAEDLADFISGINGEVPYTVLGVGSNLLVRDGGVPGVVIRLGRNFADIAIAISDDDVLLEMGAGALNANVAQFCIENGIGGLEFLSGIPGTIGGALAMNAGAYGTETKDVLVHVKLVDVNGKLINSGVEGICYHYRGRGNFPEAIFVSGVFRGKRSTSEKVAKKVREIQASREETQPIRSKTGGSTFKNPYPHKAWELIDQAGCRGLKMGGAMVSEKHCNFLINTGEATAADIEDLGEEVRRRVLAKSGVTLEWEIKRIGVR